MEGTLPLCVDLDGTLTSSDTLHELLLLALRRRPLAAFPLGVALLRGKAAFKHALAEREPFDAAHLPLRPAVLDLIRAARAAGQPVVLATASSAHTARAVAERVGLFDEVLASDGGTNLSSHRKAAALVARFGAGGFDYVGNARDDLAVFAAARRTWLVSSSGRLRRAATRQCPEIAFLADPAARGRAWLRALRLHQWLKNLLVLVPLIAAHRIGDLTLLANGLLAFLAFSLCASSVYVLNDLLDLAADRAHPTKARRPFAAGVLPVAHGLVGTVLLLGAAFGLALLLPPRFTLALAGYWLLTTAYSFVLKKQVIVDVTLLAVLYTMRLIAGSAATGVHPSFWLLAFSIFVFLSLAMVKRYSELREAMASGRTLSGRGYHAEDLPVILSLGTASGMVCVLILAMYTQATIVPNAYPVAQWLWLAPPLMLYWITRLWMKAQRGEVNEDPVVFAAKDWQSLVVASLIGGCFLFAAIGFKPW